MLEDVYNLLASEPTLANELMELADYAAGNCEKFGLLSGMGALPSPEKLAIEHWKCIADLLLTQGGEWRSSLTKTIGFPTGGAHEKATEGSDAVAARPPAGNSRAARSASKG